MMGGHDQPCGALGSWRYRFGPRGRLDGHLRMSAGCFRSAQLNGCGARCFSQLLLSRGSRQVRHAGVFSIGNHDQVVPRSVVRRSCGENVLAEVEDPSDAESIHYATLEREAPAGPTGLCITPNLIGTCNPDFNPHARGIISGLSPNTTRSQIYKGILEGLACEMSQMTDILAKRSGRISRRLCHRRRRAVGSGSPVASCVVGSAASCNGVSGGSVSWAEPYLPEWPRGEYGSLREAVEARSP